MTLEPETGNDHSQAEATPEAVAEAPASAVTVDAATPITANPEQFESLESAEVSGAAALVPVGTAPEQSSPAEAEPSALSGVGLYVDDYLEAVYTGGAFSAEQLMALTTGIEI